MAIKTRNVWRYLLFMFMALFFLTSPIHGGQMGDSGKQGASATESAIFAGGCFWCMEHALDDLPCVISTRVGYIGGEKINPTYEEVSAGGTGHAEAVLVVYDPQKISYAKLLDVFWHNIDPTVENQQFCDKGNQYRSAIFYQNDTQKKMAEASKQALLDQVIFAIGVKRFKKIATEITLASKFYEAEESHQRYHKKTLSVTNFIGQPVAVISNLTTSGKEKGNNRLDRWE